MKKVNTRREFIGKSVKLGIAVPLIGSHLLSCKFNEESKVNEENAITKKLNILILGGTSFLGPHQIAYALDRGHSVTTFTRGKTLPSVHKELFSQVTQLIGDRNDNLKALETGNWDVVIDNSGREVEWTKNTAELLKDRVDLYMYTSSTGVYYPYLTENVKEDSEVVMVEPEGVSEQEKGNYWYGVMKANSELAVANAFGTERTIVVRPTYMIGPADKSNRFIHWPVRLAKGGEILVPGKSNDPVQYADVRDVAEWMIRLAEERNAGTYNAVGPNNAQNIHEFVEEAKKAFDVESTLIKIEDYDFLREQGVFYIIPWIMADDKYVASALISNELGIKNGLTHRNLVDTVKDTYNWWYSDGLTDEKRDEFELNEQTVYFKEKEVISAWKELETVQS